MVAQSLILGEFRRSLDDRYRLSVPPELMSAWGAVGSQLEGDSRAKREEKKTEDEKPEDKKPEDREGEGETQPTVVLAKERPGCLSLWREADWQANLDAGVDVVASKLAAGRLGDSLARVQMLGRLLSSRHKTVKLAGRGRLCVPDGFRQFLAAEAGTEVMVIGAAVCIEIWQPDAWRICLNEQIPQFTEVLDELSR